MTDLEMLLAKDHIREKIYLYSRCMDRCDNDLCDAIFTEDSKLYYPPDFQGNGRQFCAWAEGNHRTMYDYTSHQYTDVIIRFKSDTEAVSETYGILSLFGREGAMGAKPNKRKVLTIHNRYIDRWQKCADGQWRICERHMCNEQNNLTDVGYYAGSHLSRRDKDDLVYKFFG